MWHYKCIFRSPGLNPSKNSISEQTDTWKIHTEGNPRTFVGSQDRQLGLLDYKINFALGLLSLMNKLVFVLQN